MLGWLCNAGAQQQLSQPIRVPLLVLSLLLSLLAARTWKVWHHHSQAEGNGRTCILLNVRNLALAQVTRTIRRGDPARSQPPV
jgi:hypothetical protein